MDIHLSYFDHCQRIQTVRKAGVPLPHAPNICINRHQYKHMVVMATEVGNAGNYSWDVDGLLSPFQVYVQ